MINGHIFHGPEEFLRAEEIKQLRARLGDLSVVALNTTELDGRRLALADLIGAAAAVPFLAESRLVVVEGLLGRLEGKAGRPTKADQQFIEGLKAHLPNLPPSTIMVFVEDHLIADTHPLMQFARAQEMSVKPFTRLSEVELRKWLTKRAELKGGALNADAVDALATAGDIDLRSLDQEIGKLVVYAGGRAVTAGDVQKLTPSARNADVFAMVDALGRRNGRKAIEQFHSLVDEGEPPVRLLFMITRQFRMILQARDLSERRTPLAEVMRSLGVSKFVAEKAMSQSRQFTPAQLSLIYRRLLETDQSIKTGQVEPLLAVDMLIAEIAARAGAAATAG